MTPNDITIIDALLDDKLLGHYIKKDTWQAWLCFHRAVFGLPPEEGDLEIFNKPTFPKGVQKGFGFHEAPRGALSHWIVIEDGKIKNYQCVVPSTWNAGPRDDKGNPGPYEASLVGNPVAKPDQPLEVLRTIHSFDPCIACAVHMLDPKGKELFRVKAL